MDACPCSYAESGDSSPRSRETDFETNLPPSLEDQPPPPVPPNHKVKFMVSYGGKIQPRNHDNQLSYVGGETKILYVERSVSFSALISKLSSLVPDDGASLSSFKYQLPGEDLDALISVSNDDDLQHLMHEYDRLYRASPKPVRFRLFLFPVRSSRFGSGSSDHDPDRFVEGLEALNSGPSPGNSGNNKVDFLFGLDNKLGQVHPDQVIGSDLEARIQDLNRLQISGPKNDGNSLAGEPYQKTPPLPAIPASVQVPASFWRPPAVRVEHQQQPLPVRLEHQQQPPPVYVVHAPQSASVYHAPPPVARPAPTQGYYPVQQVPSEPVYREQPVYTVAAGVAPLSVPPPPATVTLPLPVKVAGYSDGVGLPVRPVAGFPETTGRQVYYTTPGGIGPVTTSFPGAPAVVVSGDLRAAGGFGGVDGRVWRKKQKIMINAGYQYN